MNKDTFIDEIGKIFYEMEEDTTKIDFDLNQRNIKRRNEIMSLLKSSLQEQRQSILEEIEKVIISFDDKKEEIIKGQRFLIDDKEKLPFGYPYPDTKEKYIISKIKPNKAIK